MCIDWQPNLRLITTIDLFFAAPPGEREETTADGNDQTCEKSRMHEAELKYSNAQK